MGVSQILRVIPPWKAASVSSCKPSGALVSVKRYCRLRYRPSKVTRPSSPEVSFPSVRPAEEQPPLVLQRKAHPVKHQALQQFCVCGQKFELRTGHKQTGNSVVTELLGFASVEIIEADRRLQGTHLLALFVGRKRRRMGEIEPLTSYSRSRCWRISLYLRESDGMVVSSGFTIRFLGFAHTAHSYFGNKKAMFKKNTALNTKCVPI